MEIGEAWYFVWGPVNAWQVVIGAVWFNVIVLIVAKGWVGFEIMQPFSDIGQRSLKKLY